MGDCTPRISLASVPGLPSSATTLKESSSLFGPPSALVEGFAGARERLKPIVGGLKGSEAGLDWREEGLDGAVEGLNTTIDGTFLVLCGRASGTRLRGSMPVADPSPGYGLLR